MSRTKMLRISERDSDRGCEITVRLGERMGCMISEEKCI